MLDNIAFFFGKLEILLSISERDSRVSEAVKIMPSVLVVVPVVQEIVMKKSASNESSFVNLYSENV